MLVRLSASSRQTAKTTVSNSFWHEQVIFAEHADPENRRRNIGVAFHKSVVGAGNFKFPAALVNQRA